MSEAPQAKTREQIHTNGALPEMCVNDHLQFDSPFVTIDLQWGRASVEVFLPPESICAHAAAFRELADKLDALAPAADEEQA